MNLTTISSSKETTRLPLVLHIRSLRQWHGDQGISQSELAYLAGITPRLLHDYEAAPALPSAVRTLMSLAIALEIPIEQLIAPQIRDELQAAIKQRRSTLGQLTGDRRAPRSRRLL